MSRSSSAVSLDVNGSVAEVILSRPEQLNSVNVQMMEDMIAAITDISGRSDIRAVVLGSTGKVFSAGGDFDLILEQQRSAEARERSADLSRRYFHALINCPQPIVAGVQGDIIGAGVTLALTCDAIVCSRTARIGDPHVAIGLATGDGETVLLPETIGLLRARRYLLTGDRMSAEDAHSMGLVTDLVDTPAEALPGARAMAERIAALPPLAVQYSKKILIDGLRPRIETMFEKALALEMATFSTEDVVEAVDAFRTKRTPEYRGR